LGRQFSVKFSGNKARILLRFSKCGNTLLPCIRNIMVQTSNQKLVTLTDGFVVHLFLPANAGMLAQIRSWTLASIFFLFIIHLSSGQPQCFFRAFFTAVIYIYIYIHIIHFHLFHSVNIYLNWLQKQFCYLSLYTLYILSV